MGNGQRTLLSLILLASNGIGGGSVLFGQETPPAKLAAAKESGQCMLSFQYLEGPGLALPQNIGVKERSQVISAKERSAWLDQVKDKPDVWMMKEPVKKFHACGPGDRDRFGAKESDRLNCDYFVTLEEKGTKLDIDLKINVSMGESLFDFRGVAHRELAGGDTLLLQSPHPKKNFNRVLLVDVKKRSVAQQRVVRLELLHLEGNHPSAHRPNWSGHDAKYRFGVPKKEVEEWFRKSGTTLEAWTSKRTYKDAKTTETWTIVDHGYDAPTDIYPEVVGIFAEFFLLKKISVVDFTVEDRITRHSTNVQLVPDPGNENAPLPFVLRSDVLKQRGKRSASGWGSEVVPKPGHYLAIDTTKPHAQNWTMLLIRAVEDGEF